MTAWVRGFLVEEMKAHAGDPGRVVVRRLSNAEYDNTVRDLTGVDLRPTRDFPADGAAGEGFTNAGDALVMSPTLLTKYLKAAKEIAAHAVLLPDGFRFSPSVNRRDWTDETLAELRKAYRESAPGPDDGRLDFTPYLAATIAHRDDLAAGKITTAAVAIREKLNPKYLQILWQALTDKEPSPPLDRIRARWRLAVAEGCGSDRGRGPGVAGPALEIQQDRQLHEHGLAGRRQSRLHQFANDPIQAEPAAGTERGRLVSRGPRPGRRGRPRRLATAALRGRRARFWAGPPPSYLLRDALGFDGRLDAAYRTVYADTSDYLSAAKEAASNSCLTAEDLAKKHDLDATVLKHWIAYLDLAPTAAKPKPTASASIPANSVLARWRSAAADPKRRDELAKLAHQVRDLMTGDRPADKNNPDRVLYDALASLDGPLFQGIDLIAWARDAPAVHPAGGPRLGLDPSRFVRDPEGKTGDADSLAAPGTSVIEVRLPTALLQNREFIVDATLEPGSSGGPVQFEARLDPPDMYRPPAVGSPLTAGADLCNADRKQQEAGFDAFRRCFPTYRYYAKIIPDDEIINLRLFAREDDVLVRTFLDEGQKQRLDRLWTELRFVSQQPLIEEKNYPQFLGFVSQDGPEPFKKFKATTEEGVHRRAAEFTKDLEAAAPKQFDALLDFAARAYRRPLEEKEKSELRKLYDGLRKKEMTHEEAFRTGADRRAGVAVVPLSHRAAVGRQGAAAGFELGTGDAAELFPLGDDARRRTATTAAAAGKLTDPGVLAAQAGRMLKDPKMRGLATEFATQWLHVRDIQEQSREERKAVSHVRRQAPRRRCSRNRPVLPGPVPERSLGAGNLRRRLHLRQRDAGQALRHSGRRRARSGGASTASRSMAAAACCVGQRAGGPIGCVADQPGAARQLAGRNAAGRKDSQAAGQCSAACRTKRRAATI